MDPNKQKLALHALKYATFTLVGIVMVFGVVAFMRNDVAGNLEGRLLNAQERGTVPRSFFTGDRAVDGFTAPADTHVVFTVPNNGAGLSTVTFFGGPQYDETVAYWWYCFSGNEWKNKNENKRGRALYDGKIGYSKAEIKRQTPKAPRNADIMEVFESRDLRSPLPHSEMTHFAGGETCYLMAQSPLPLGVDEDQDGLNSAFERNIGTNRLSADTDNDGITDGQEVFTVGTSPTLYDSDGDNLSDGYEDKNRDGLNNGETSPLLADTDRDGLCDGDGTGEGCPEPDSYPFRGEDFNQDGIVDEGETDPKKADTDGNGFSDLEQRWAEFDLNPTGNRR